ncbi:MULTISPECIES: ABC transporter ATP-binding protein [Cyanophyceae]|uniref:ABC transporter ATP-binding protein n=1 Tax=Cyanophyceae TaxID=3028117 RepID=UPI00232B1C5E|nr:MULTISPECIES: ABC transporter ATP-binding protein [Cyanophyceae]MDB9356464.1 ABC transporter ATP-binding protein [Nodularia spumigena CS-587/03]MDB9302795.1 ABC transporter ATP-binding protein [Nodularia spumigena CS-591/12]MDB9340895.1 ABC transporter ATP-binding protein [Nodularia spumigena CS-589/07]MDB9343521.1 ABC transporter ATP-binding protein [Nodularia spumigena CS-588/06]MDB9370149.1 ABC transporter ATP-binding protein [Nodularia spumigena CS-586/05]
MAQTVTQNPNQITTSEELDVELRHVFKFFNNEPAVHGVDLNVKQGEFFSILGPSGCGKTTILRLIAGFEMTDAGKVLIQGQPMSHVPAYRRPVNTVFQSYALFNHMNVWDNIAFGLRLHKKIPKSEIETRVKEALELVKMESWRSRFPNQLSGGQQQRVALARALVNRPTVLLLDEPLGALDLKLRKDMQVELASLHKNLGLTFIMVTHDQQEAMSLSDRIAVMNQGKIEQVGTPKQIYEHPQTSFVANFIGDTNLFSGEITHIESSSVQIATKNGLKIVVTRYADTPSELSQAVVVSVRPEKIQLSLYQPHLLTNCFEGRLGNVMYLGTHVNYVVELTNGVSINVLQPNTLGNLPDRNTPIYAWWAESDCVAINQ